MFREWLDYAPKAVAAFSFALLTLTIVHEWGFFWVIGPYFQSLVSAYDYLSSAVLWLPQNLLIILAIVIIRALAIKLTQGRLGFWPREDGPRAAGLTKEDQRKFQRVALSTIILGAAVAILTFFFLTEYVTLFYAFAFFNLWFGVFALFHNEQYSLGRTKASLILILPVALVFVFAEGAADAEWAMTSFENRAYKITYKEPANESLFAYVIRTLDKGIIIRDPINNRTEFIRWETIRSVGTFHNVQPNNGISGSCLEFHILCKAPPPNP
jgi:hypothetical protein